MGETKYRADYKPLDYQIKHTELKIELEPHQTQVTNTMFIERTGTGSSKSALELDGKDLKFKKVFVNFRELNADEYEVSPDHLTIFKLPKKCTVTVENDIDPTSNTSCEGLYRTDGTYVTQCESEAFRRITYFQDRPDNLATYTTTVVADQNSNPLLLSNGNIKESKVLPNGKHMRVFDDPIPKPSYLFALVAGDLRTVSDYYMNKDGKKIDLQIHVQGDKAAKTMHAMKCLKAAFKWDEETYKLPYDLDVYNIVGAPDFNAGAMENKGLNIFNDNAVLVSPQTGTDHDFEWLYTVVGHEFFHNYAGNRVTIRDWFELALKEGLATQKEREFKADMCGYTQARISDVNSLRTLQFPEDSGPNAHPVRNDSYQNIANFYTTTTYSKGAELLSMLSGLLGQEVWRQGVKEYFTRLDGTAATIDQFLDILGEVAAKDLTQFKRWYTQPGTPNLSFTEKYDKKSQTYSLTVLQTCANTAGYDKKEPFHIPIKMALLDKNGKEISLKLKGQRKGLGKECMLELTENQQTFVFTGVKSKPTASVLRDFSAPVKIAKSLHSNEDLMFLMAKDTNEFNRYEAADKLHERVILEACDALQAGYDVTIDKRYLEANRLVLKDPSLSEGLKADILSFPTDTILLNKMKDFDPTILQKAMGAVSEAVTGHLQSLMAKTYKACQENCTDEYSPENAGKRQLKNLCLSRLAALAVTQENSVGESYLQLAGQQFHRAQNLTDKLGALKAVFSHNHSSMTSKAHKMGCEMMSEFYEMWKNDPLVVAKWLNKQAMYDGNDTIAHMQSMIDHPGFRIENPNDIRALLRVFIRSNHKHFHDPSGAGYAFIVDCCLKIDEKNSYAAAGIAKAMVNTNNLGAIRTQKMIDQLERLLSHEISDQMSEVVSKALDGYKAKLAHAVETLPVEVNSSQEQGVKKLSRLLEQGQEEELEATPALGTQFLMQFAQEGYQGDTKEPQRVRRSARLAHK